MMGNCDVAPRSVHFRALKSGLCPQKLVVALQTEDGRKTINGTTLRIVEAGETTEKELADLSDLEQALQEHFGLVIPAEGQ